MFGIIVYCSSPNYISPLPLFVNKIHEPNNIHDSISRAQCNNCLAQICLDLKVYSQVANALSSPDKITRATYLQDVPKQENFSFRIQVIANQKKLKSESNTYATNRRILILINSEGERKKSRNSSPSRLNQFRRHF